MSQVDDLHHPHNEGHPYANQGIEATEQESLDQGLQKEFNLTSHILPPMRILDPKHEIQNTVTA